jgi:redox-sensitive bicupin YhaK (pirin superfamily)
VPAVEPADASAVPRVEPPRREGVADRRVRLVTTAPAGLEGEGFPVRRAFAGVPLALLDPFVHLDQMGEVDYGPGEARGTPWHPHRGFETVTYLIDGVFEHRDSTGGGGRIENGATQWMTAGAGVLHIERPPESLVRSGGVFHGIQLWVNLPAAKKWVPPRYQYLPRDAVGLGLSPDGGVVWRVIAGEVGPVRGPGRTHTPITLVHASVEPGAEAAVPWPRGHNALVYVLAGSVVVGREARPLREGQLAVLGPGELVVVGSPRRFGQGRTGGGRAEVLLLGGEPLREPVAHYGPFVMTTQAEIRQAFEDYHAGRLGTVPPGEA